MTKIFDYIIIALITLTLITGIYGWHEAFSLCPGIAEMHPSVHCPAQMETFREKIGPAVYFSLHAFGPSDLYLTPPNGWTSFARFVGVLVVFSAIIRVFLAFASNWLTEISARLKKNHLVIYGLTPLTAAIARSQALKKRQAIVVPFDDDKTLTRTLEGTPNVLLLKPANPTLDLVRVASAHRASEIVFGGGNDARNLAIASEVMGALSAQKPHAAKRTRTPRAFAHLNEPSFENTFGSLQPELHSLEVISEAQLGARRIVVEHDFLGLARERAQDRVHTVIIGFGATGRAVLEEIALTCWATDLADPMVTVLDKKATQLKTAYLNQRRGAARAIEVTFEDFDAIHANLEDETALHRAEGRHLLTAIVVCIGGDDINTLAVGRLLELQHVHLRARAIIFVRERRRGSPWNTQRERLDHGVVDFGAASDLAQKCSVFCKGFTALAEVMHDAWRSTLKPEDPRNIAWPDAPRWMRLANELAANHIYAKLGSARIAPEDFRIDVTKVPALTDHAFSRIRSDLELMARLGRAEHARWKAEKHLNGWRAPDDTGRPAGRDDERKRHQLLTPANELESSEKEKDRRLIEELLNHVATVEKTSRETQDVWRPILRIGFFGPLSLTKEARENLRRHFQELAGNTLKQDIRESSVTLLTPGAPGFDLAGPRLFAGEAVRVSKRPVRVLSAQAMSFESLQDAAEDYCDREDAAADRAELANAKHVVWNCFEMTPPDVSRVDLRNNQELRETLFRRAAAYIVERSDIIISMGSIDALKRSGNTSEALSWALGEHQIPHGVSSLPAFCRGGSLGMERQLIVFNKTGDAFEFRESLKLSYA